MTWRSRPFDNAFRCTSGFAMIASPLVRSDVGHATNEPRGVCVSEASRVGYGSDLQSVAVLWTTAQSATTTSLALTANNGLKTPDRLRST